MNSDVEEFPNSQKFSLFTDVADEGDLEIKVTEQENKQNDIKLDKGGTGNKSIQP